MVAFEIKVDTRKMLQRISWIDRPLRQRQYLKLLHQRFLYWINENFRREGIEEKWAPLSPKTIARRRKKGRGARILRDTGRMAQSFVRDSKVDFTNNEVKIGSQDKKSEWHHFGTKHIPARQLLPSEELADDIAHKLLDAFINRVVRK